MKALSLLYIGIGTLGALALCATSAHGQGVVIAGTSSARFIELRPLALDSVPRTDTDSAWSVYRRTGDGILARCGTTPYCTFFRSAGRTNLVAMLQDMDVTAWGFGQGISAHAQLRARSAVGDGRDLWPQARQTFDVLSAYGEVERPRFRARLGRQWATSGLGVFNYDGASLVLRGPRGISGETYVGGSLVEGLNRPLTTDILSPVEDLPPTDDAFLLGAAIQLKSGGLGGARVQYQREVRRDREGLYSERVAANGELHVAHTTLSGQLTHDLATGDFNELSVALRAPFPGGVDARIEARHYVPFFDLWTIWGAFAPVGYNELRADVQWSAIDARMTVGLSGARRSYEDTRTGVAFLPLRNDGWRLGATGALRATDAWTMQGAYRVDVGFGASGSNGDVALRWSPGERISLTAHGVVFQNIYEFQIGEGRVFGGGAEASVGLTPDLRVAADAYLYRHSGFEQPQLVNWNQRRGSVRLEWTVGSQPDARNPGRLP
jgi:hypothetical protein